MIRARYQARSHTHFAHPVLGVIELLAQSARAHCLPHFFRQGIRFGIENRYCRSFSDVATATDVPGGDFLNRLFLAPTT